MEQIMYDSDEATKFVTDIKGWVDSKGFFYGNNKQSESVARYAGCTHRPCKKCGKPAKKMYTLCHKCREIAADERYLKRELVEWDGVTPVYSEIHDKYFFDEDSLAEFVEENGPVLRLLLCERSKLSKVDYERWEEEIHENDELPEKVKNAIDNLNKCIDECEVDYWLPGDKRIWA